LEIEPPHEPLRIAVEGSTGGVTTTRDAPRANDDAARAMEITAPAAEATPRTEPPRVAVPEPLSEPVRRDEVKRPVVDVPPISSTLPADSGLEIVETKFRPAPEAEPEAVPAGPRRVRPPRVAIPDEPLQIVETRKGDQPPAG
jgi:hypothetical protein